MFTRPEVVVVFPRAAVTGGVERVALALLRYEAARRDACFVGEHCDSAGIAHVRVAGSRLPGPLRPAAFRRAAGRALDGLHASTVVSFGVECPPGDVYWVQSVHAAWLATGGDVTVRGRPVPPRARRLLLRHQVLLRLERDYFTRHRPRAILCTSTREVDDLARLYDVPRETMRLAPNGFDGSVFSPRRRAELRAGARARIGAGADEIVVLMVANEWHRKGLGTLLEAVAAAREPRLRVDLVGARSPRDYAPVAERLGLSGRVHWHGPSDDVAAHYAAADVFVLPTTYEPFGMVVVEAMAMGLPVVVSALAGAAAAIDDGVSGLLLSDPLDAGALADALQRLDAEPERRRMGDAAAHAALDYEWARLLARVDSVLFPS